MNKRAETKCSNGYGLKRYRGRVEWYGVELFDRKHGKVVPLDVETTKIFLNLYNKVLENDIIKEASFENKISLPELFKDGKWNVEPLIDTPYPKTQVFASSPRRIYWELTRNCNLNCKSCFNRFFSSQTELSAEQIISIAKQAYEAGIYEIRCTGGEPTTRPDFFDIVKELSSMGFYLSMGTNGIYTEETLQKVMVSPIDWIIISLDGRDEGSNSEIRGKGNFIKTLNTIKHLSSRCIRIRINTLIRKTHYRYEDLKPLAKVCDRFNIESLNCIPLRPLTNDPETLNLQLTPQEFKEFITGLNRLRKEHKTDFVTTLDLRHTEDNDRIYFKDHSCAAGREGAVISPYGEIYGCSYSLASDPTAAQKERIKYVAGNLLQNDLLQIWNQSKNWAIYRDLDLYKHKTCKTCEYYISRRCIGNCPIMDRKNPASFDPYCYLHLESKDQKHDSVN